MKMTPVIRLKLSCWVESPYVYVTIYGTREDPISVEIERVITDTKPYETVTQEDDTLAPGITKKDVYGHTGYTVETYRVVKDAEGKSDQPHL